jgi:hypothetical protein
MWKVRPIAWQMHNFPWLFWPKQQFSKISKVEIAVLNGNCHVG